MLIAGIREAAGTAEVLAFSIRDASRVSGLSETRIRQLITEGKLRARQVGARKFILRPDLERFFEDPRLDP